MSSLNNEYNPGASFTNRFEQTKREVRTLEFEKKLIYQLEEEQQWLKSLSVIGLIISFVNQ